MKAVRILALGFAIVVAGAAVASAQGAPTQQGQGAGRRPNMQLNGIELTDAQKVKFEEIQKKYQPEMQAIRESMMNGGDRADAMKKMTELRDKSGAELRAILTTEQQAVFDKNMAEMKAQMEARQRQAPPAR